jgi:predicted RNA binding protein YcfA (HicA-like mRNA interferase family)
VGSKQLPQESGKQLAKVFASFGWELHRGGRNHFVLTHPDKPPFLNISIPDHKTVDRCLLRSQIKKAGLTEEQFLEAYSRL